MKTRPRLLIDKKLAGKWWEQMGCVFVVFILTILSIALLYTLFRGGSFFKNIAPAFVDMTNPETVHYSVYDTISENNRVIISDMPAPSMQKKQPDIMKMLLHMLVYIIGTIVFTGLFIATITNIFRSRSEKFRRGAVEYKFKNHIVFLGYNNMIPGMIQKICVDKDNEDDIKNVRIVVGVEDNASAICDKIKNRLYDDYRDRVVVLKADSCNRKDLKRLRITYADEVYIIGEHDDAYNLKCYRTIYELSLCDYSRGSKMPKCYVNLHSQATLTLFRTYASADELGIDFTQFHSYSFYDEWAKYLIKKHWKIDENRQDHFIIAGMTEMGIALARKIVLLCHKPGKNKRTIITLIDNDMIAKSKLFITQNQDFFERCHYTIKTKQEILTHEPLADMDLLDVAFEFIEGNLSDEEIRLNLDDIALDKKKATIIAICYDDPQQNITMGLSLPKVINGENCDVRVWIYQPTSGDLGKYLESDRYVYFETFGMSGDDLDVRNRDCTDKAMYINHFFLHKKEKDIDFSNSFLIKTEWEGTDIAKRWICIRHAEFIPFLAKFQDNDSKMTEMERNRSTADIFLFGETDLYSLKNNFYSKYINVLKGNIASKELTHI
jgi:hypothetical protein